MSIARFNPDSPLASLMAAPARPGRVEWLGLRPDRRAPVNAVMSVQFDVRNGLVGDRYRGGSGNRQVTLIQAEHLVAIAAYLGLVEVPPELLRRNIVVRGLNLLALQTGRFRTGTAVLQGTGLCHPCSRMEEVLGVGGYNAVRGHGGITARVLQCGVATLHDAVTRLDES
jgi:MOSC domain-containing protein YiiM